MAETPEMADRLPLCGVGSGSGSPARLAAMVRENVVFVGRVVRNLGFGGADLDDLVQQVFSVAAARVQDIQPEKERAFLAQTAVRMAANARRHEKRLRAREVVLGEIPDVAASSPSPEELSDRRRALELLDHALAGLSFDLRSVFVLYEVEQMTMGEITGALGIPSGTVASRLRRAREEFTVRLQEMGLGCGQEELK